MISVSKNVYNDKLDDIVNKYNNTYSTIKIKPVDVKSNTYIDSNIDKLYDKRKGYENSFNSLIDKKDIV